MTTLRVKKDKHYFTASNEPFNDERLSWEARGLLAYLLSKPDDWTVRMYDLIQRGPAGRDKIQRMLKELEDCGYLERKCVQSEEGKFEWETHIYESTSLNPGISQSPPEEPTIDGLSGDGSPVDDSSIDGLSVGGSAVDGLSVSGLAVDGSSVDGKPVHLISTDLQRTDPPKTDQKNTQKELARRERLRTPGTPDASSGKGDDSSKRKREPSLDHPSLTGFKRMTGFHVRPSWREDVVAEIGKHPERVKRWVKLVKSWVGRGFNPNNVAGMLDAFRKGGLPAQGPKDKKGPEEINYSQLWREEERRAKELGLDE